jgi:hypothetical protein
MQVCIWEEFIIPNCHNCYKNVITFTTLSTFTTISMLTTISHIWSWRHNYNRVYICKIQVTMLNFCQYRHRLTFTNSGLIPPRFTKVPVPSHENDQSCICVIGIAICKRFKLFGFPRFRLDEDYSRKRVMRTKLDIYVFFYCICFCKFTIRFWSCPDSVVSVVFTRGYAVQLPGDTTCTVSTR